MKMLFFLYFSHTLFPSAGLHLTLTIKIDIYALHKYKIMLKLLH